MVGAAEGRLGGRKREAVDADHPGLERRHRAPRALGRAGEGIGREPHVRGIGAGEHLVFGGKAGDRRDRAEVLLGEDLHLVGDIGEHGRLEEIAAVEMRRALTAMGEHGARAQRVAHDCLDLGQTSGVDQRPHPGFRVEPVAQPDRRGARDEARDEGVMQAFMHEDPVGGDADLPAIGEFRRHRQIQRIVQIGVVIDDQRRVAAKLHRHLLHRLGGVADHLLADPGRAGQADLAHPAVGHDRGIGVGGRADDKVHRSRRQSARAQAIDHHHRHAGRLRRGPQHHRAAGGQRRRQFARRQCSGEVPGGEGADDAHRLAAHLETAARHPAFDDPAIDPPRLFGEPAELVAGQAPFAPGLRDRLAGLGRDHPRRLVAAADHLIRRTMQRLGAGKAAHFAQFRQRAGRGPDRGAGLLCCCHRHLAERFFGDRRDDLSRYGAGRPVTVDEQSELRIHVLPDFADLDGAPLCDGADRRLGQDQRLTAVLEAHGRGGAGLDRIDEGPDLGREGGGVAVDEEIHQRRCLVGEGGAREPHVIARAVFRNRHAGRAEGLDALVIAIDRAARIGDDRLLARGRRQHCGHRVEITAARHQLGVDEPRAGGADFGHLLAKEEAGHVEIVDRHVAEDPARDLDIGGGCQARIARGDDDLFERADPARLDCGAHGSVPVVEAAHEAKHDRHRRTCNFCCTSVDARQRKVDRLLAQRGFSGSDGLFQKIGMGRCRGRDQHRVDRT
ncbi:hypothetical protein SDC9_25600 [bioreactor metagenome]|uniref:Uncharacterized protein n=1 Tax=bioreactor metagenome TaxID=1076179 RepID=A0A644UKZ0_9ZZZZ